MIDKVVYRTVNGNIDNFIEFETFTIGVGKKSPLPPNRMCDSLAYGSFGTIINPVLTPKS